MVASLSYFNPRTREGCDGFCVYSIKRHYIISIHAPVKGATLDKKYNPEWEEAKFQSTHP